MPKCDYCGHPVYPPDESGNNAHVACIMQTMIDEHWAPGE